jgi:hypothetical protein
VRDVVEQRRVAAFRQMRRLANEAVAEFRPRCPGYLGVRARTASASSWTRPLLTRAVPLVKESFPSRSVNLPPACSTMSLVAA